MVYKNIPVRQETWERLRAYKMASATYDEVLTELMNSLPLEDVAEGVVREHKARMASDDWTDWRDVRENLGD